MFSTTSAAKLKVPAPIAQAGHMYWLAVSLETFTPWYLVTYRISEGDDWCLETICLAWGSSLLELIKSASVHSINCLTPRRDRAGEWQMVEVLEAREPSAKNNGPLVFRLAESGEAVDVHHEPVADNLFRDAKTVFKKQS